MRLTKLVATPSILGNFAERQLTDWVDWKMLYRQLLAEDRIWDFRDVFLAVSACYSTEDALRTFFDYDPSMESLLVDWQTELQDESTNLALLDILSLTALATGTYTGVHYLAESCVQLAEPIGNSLLNSSPHIIHSRPFLRWVVAKAVVNSGPRNFKYFSDYPGLTVFPRIEGMPYYIPISQENPSWLPLDAKPGSHESLQLALKSSRIIRDYKTESLCLRELALRTQDPGELLHELGKLQRFTQHNMDGYLVTLLSRYLVCRDYSSKGELLKDMESFGIWNDPSDLVNPTGVAARAVLQHALSRDPADNAGQSLGSALRYYEYLPKPFQRLIDRHYPVPRSTVSRDGLGSPLSISTKRPSWAKSSQEKKPHSIPESETTVRIDRDQDEGLIINIKGPQAHDQSVPSSQSADHLQAGESKPRQRRNAKSSQALGKQKSQDISKREDLTPESFRDLVRFGAPGHRDSLTDSDDSSVSSSDSSTTESRTEDTEAAKHGVKTIKDVDTERVMDSTGAHSGKQSRSRSESLQDPVRQAGTCHFAEDRVDSMPPPPSSPNFVTHWSRSSV